jgi:DNA-directed RNA polymerase subunit E"
MTKEKACKLCKTIYEGEKCTRCGAKESIEGFKGRIAVINPEKSEIAQKLNIKEKGNFAIKVK